MDDKWYFLYDIQAQRHKEDLAAAEQYRLARQTSPARPIRQVQKRVLLRRFMFALGSRLMSWGCRLQTMYE